MYPWVVAELASVYNMDSVVHGIVIVNFQEGLQWLSSARLSTIKKTVIIKFVKFSLNFDKSW